MLCEYGCGQEAKYLLKSGKWCCCKTHKKCPEVLRKNKEGQQRRKVLRECPHCHRLISDGMGGQFTTHLKHCISNVKEKTVFKAIGNVNEDIARWTKWYNNIIKYRIENPLIEGYKERHHIIPKSLGGSNDKSNLVDLTAKEHYICHLLLVRMNQSNKEAYKKMVCALFKLAAGNKHYSSNTYKIYREALSNIMKGHHNQDGEKNSAWGKKWISNVELKISKMVKPAEVEDYLNTGWIYGNKAWIKLERENLNKINKKIKKEKILKVKQNNKEIYEQYYKLYNKVGWESFKQLTNYKYSKQNFVMMCKKWVNEFIPQNGKKRGNNKAPVV